MTLLWMVRIEWVSTRTHATYTPSKISKPTLSYPRKNRSKHKEKTTDIIRKCTPRSGRPDAFRNGYIITFSSIFYQMFLFRYVRTSFLEWNINTSIRRISRAGYSARRHKNTEKMRRKEGSFSDHQNSFDCVPKIRRVVCAI